MKIVLDIDVPVSLLLMLTLAVIKNVAIAAGITKILTLKAFALDAGWLMRTPA